MAELNIVDSGYLTPAREGTQLSSSLRANSGTTIALKGVTFGISSGGNYDDSPTLNNFQISRVNFASVENDKFTISGIIREDDATDQAYVYQLSRLPKTIGMKILYYDSTSSDKNKQLITQMSNSNTLSSAQQTAYGIGAAYNYLNVVFTKFDITQEAGSPVERWSLEGIVLPFS